MYVEKEAVTSVAAAENVGIVRFHAALRRKFALCSHIFNVWHPLR